MEREKILLKLIKVRHLIFTFIFANLIANKMDQEDSSPEKIF